MIRKSSHKVRSLTRARLEGHLQDSRYREIQSLSSSRRQVPRTIDLPDGRLDIMARRAGLHFENHDQFPMREPFERVTGSAGADAMTLVIS